MTVWKEQEHLKTAVRTCVYPDWTFSKTSRKRGPKKETISIPFLSGQRRVQPKDTTPRHKQSNVIAAVQSQEDIGDINSPSINLRHNTDVQLPLDICT